MTSDELLRALREKGGKHVYNHCLLDENVYIFEKLFGGLALSRYHDFKIAVSSVLDVSAKNVAIVGSAKTGFSLAPRKNFSAFGDQSDLDLVIVSPVLFRSLWDSYLNFISGYAGVSYSLVAKNVFKHFISIKDSELVGDKLIHFSEWAIKVGELKRSLQLEFRMPADINYRIYEDWSFVERYHVAGLNDILSEQ